MRTSAVKQQRKRSKGQAMVEFAITFPILIVVIFALVEFGFYLKDFLGLRFASLEAARTVAAEGTLPQDDKAAMMTISNSGMLGVPLDQVDYVEVYHATSLTDDCPVGYNCGGANGTPRTYPNNPVSPDMLYKWKNDPAHPGQKAWLTDTLGYNNWAPNSRNDVIPTDVAAIYIKFHHYWVDPLLHSLDNNNGHVDIQTRSIMPIEPACYADDAQYCLSQH